MRMGKENNDYWPWARMALGVLRVIFVYSVFFNSVILKTGTKITLV